MGPRIAATGPATITRALSIMRRVDENMRAGRKLVVEDKDGKHQVEIWCSTLNSKAPLVGGAFSFLAVR